MRRALITGMGQDGTYLAEYLLGLGTYQVFGMIRRQFPLIPIAGVEYLYGDLRDEMSIGTALRKAWPEEIYNLGGCTSVPVSWNNPAEAFDVNTGGLARILKIVEATKKDTKIFQANSATMFGNHDGLCNEYTPFAPLSPYCISKVAAHSMVGLARKRGIYASAGIAFNHESPRRGHEGVTRKIVCHVVGWAMGDTSTLYLGNMKSRRDWGFAGDYVQAMHAMLQQEQPGDYVLGTGVSHTVDELLTLVCSKAGVPVPFAAEHLNVDERMQRAQEIVDSRADASKAKRVLDWEPKVDFDALIGMMVEAERASRTSEAIT